MPIRNPFARRPGPAAALQHDENQRPGSSASGSSTTDPAHPGFERVDTVGSKASSAFSIRSNSRRSHDTGEYKMSVVNDSGVYLPPSPVEREATWPRRYLARTSSDKSSIAGGAEIEHFPISRESFDSYRRSFDISARSPVINPSEPPLPARMSLDSSLVGVGAGSRSSPFLSPRFPRSSLSDQFPHHSRRWEQPPTPEESEREDGRQGGGEFEDVRLGDDASIRGGDETGEKGLQQQQQQPPPQKKRGFFAKFGSDHHQHHHHAAEPAAAAEEGGTGTGTGAMMSRFLPSMGMGGGRKRAPSGSGLGSELGAMPAPRTGLEVEGRQAQEVEA